MVGWAGRALPGQTDAGVGRAFVRKYDVDGNERWTRQFGTSSEDEALGVSVDSLPGQTSAGRSDAFVRVYDADGKELWSRQLGTSGNDKASGVWAGSAGVYVAGHTFGTLQRQTDAGATDAFVVKFK